LIGTTGKHNSLIGTIIQDRYRVLSCIGEGGMGVVYEVEHVLIGRRFALKTLSPYFAEDSEMVMRFHREARAAAAIGDKHIVEVSDMGVLPNGSPYIVQELLRGNNLREELSKTGPLPISRTVRIATQCCHALDKVHKIGIVHRDIKPDNIFLIADRETKDFVKILDFGTAKAREASISLTTGRMRTKTGIALGTPYYMPPEQISGDTNIDARADVYALGVVIFQMLIGRVPFEAPTYPLLSVKILEEPPPSLVKLRSDIPVDLEKAVHRTLAKEPEGRFASMEELAFVLAPFSTLSGRANLTAFGIASARAAKGKTTPKAWESKFGSIRTIRVTKKTLGLSLAAGVVVILLSVLSVARIFNPAIQTHEIESTVIPATEQPLEKEVVPEVLPISPLPKEPIPESQPPRLATEKEPSVGDKQPLVPAKAKSNKTNKKRTASIGKPIEKLKPKKKRDLRDTDINPYRATAATRSTVSAPEPNRQSTSDSRIVRLHNQRRAKVELSFVCRGTSKKVNISARSNTTVELPHHSCSIVCTGLGNPKCPLTIGQEESQVVIQ